MPKQLFTSCVIAVGLISGALISGIGCSSNDPFAAQQASATTVAWQHLATVTLDDKLELTRIDVGGSKGKFSSLSLVLRGTSAELREVKVYFTDGKSFNAGDDVKLDYGQQSFDFDIPNTTPREIDRVVLKATNLGSGPPKIVLYGK